MIPQQNQLQPAPVLSLSGTVRFSISNARQQFKQREFAEAVLNYIAVLKSHPVESRGRYLIEFLEALRAYLQQEGNDTNINDVLQISTSIYGHEFRFWRLMAEHYFNRGKLMKSLEILEKAMGCAKNDIEWLQASTSIENVKTNLFDAWHWRMINDEKRNQKFAAAITTALDRNPGARVLDIGCGSGIFSVLAARNGNFTFACDQNEVMCNIARNCFALNGVDVALFEQHSKQLQPSQLLNLPCNLLITETVDSAIFGERIIETILDAKERGLLANDAVIIPNKATAIFSLVQADSICMENFYEHSNSTVLISNCCNLAELNGKRIVPPSPYNCCHLNELSHGYRLLSEPVEGLAVNFGNIHQLRQIKNDRFLTEVVLTATEEGTASAVCVWFKLNLYEEYEICTKPEEGYSWQQAIFPFYPPRKLSPGDSLRFEVFIKGSGMHVQPIGGLAVTGREILRAPHWMDLAAMNDPAIRAFFTRAARKHRRSQVLDCTDLLIGDGQFTIASGQSAIRYIGKGAVSLEKAVCKPDGVILFWPFSTHGNLLDDYLTSILELHARTARSQIQPCQIALKGCLISSEELSRKSRLLDSPAERELTYCGVDLSAMDEYKVVHFHEIETRTLCFQQISDDMEMFRMTFGDEPHNDLNQLTRVKKECVFTCATEAEEGGDNPNPVSCHAILYWYEIFDADGNSLDLRRQTFGHLSSAFILPKPKRLQPGAMLKAQYSMMHGSLLFHSVKDFVYL